MQNIKNTSKTYRSNICVHFEELISSRTVVDKFGGEDGRDGTLWGTDLFSHCCWQVRRGGWERRYTLRNWSLLVLLWTSSAGRMGETVHFEELISSRTTADKFGEEDGRDGTLWGTDLFSYCCGQVRRGGWERRYTMRNWSLLALLLTSSAGRMGETESMCIKRLDEEYS